MAKRYDLNNFGVWLRCQLAERMMTQRELAEKADSHYVSINRYISGTRKPRCGELEKILNVLDSHIEIVPNERECAEIELEGGTSTWWHVCGECHGAVDEKDRFCKHCGIRLIR